MAGGEKGAREAGMFLGPEMDGGPVNASGFGGGRDGLACDESLKDVLLNGSERGENGGFGRHGCSCSEVTPTDLTGSGRILLK